MKSYGSQYRDLIKERDRQIEDLKKDNDNLRGLSLLTPEKFKFNERENAIIGYVKTNPGKTQIAVIDALKNSEDKKSNQKQYGTPVTITNSINELNSLNVLRIEREHKQKFRLYVNDDGILLSTYNQLSQFKKAFHNLINRISDNKEWQNPSEDQRRSPILTGVIAIYHHLLNMYIMYILLKWSIELRNDQTLLNKIYSMIFFTIIEIHSEFAKKFNLPYDLPDKPTAGHLISPLLRNIIMNSFVLTPNVLINIISEYSKFNLHADLMPLIDSVWKIGFPVFRYLHLRDLIDLFHLSESIDLIGREFPLLMVLCLDDKDRHTYNIATRVKREKSKLFGLNWGSDDDRRKVKKILSEVIKENPNMSKILEQLKTSSK